MEDKGSKAGSILKTIIFLFLFVVIIGSFYYAYRFYQDIQMVNFDTLYSEKLYLEKKDELQSVEQRKTDLTKEVEELEDVSQSIKFYHDRYFELAKELEHKVENDETDLKIAYLTFDDGPYRMSYKFLDVLDEYDVEATFFYLKKCAEYGYRDDYIYDEVYQRVINSGHTLGNHTASHQLGEDGIYSSVERFMDDIEENRSFIQDRYGYTTEVMRFPGGSSTSYKAPLIKEELSKIHYAWVDWNSETGDGRKVLPPDEYRDNVLNKTAGKKFLVVLMHDYSENTLIALPEIIEGLSKQGYVFLPLFYDSVAVNR